MIEKPNLLHLKSFLIKFSFYQIGKRSFWKVPPASYGKKVHANAMGGILNAVREATQSQTSCRCIAAGARVSGISIKAKLAGLMGKMKINIQKKR